MKNAYLGKIALMILALYLLYQNRDVVREVLGGFKNWLPKANQQKKWEYQYKQVAQNPESQEKDFNEFEIDDTSCVDVFENIVSI